MKNLAIALMALVMAGCATASGKKSTEQSPQRSTAAEKSDSPFDDGQAISAEEKEFIKFCETENCRHNVRITLKQKDGTVFKYTKSLFPPVVQPAFVTILAGETVYLEAEVGEDGPINLKAVDEIEHADRTIVFQLKQEPAMAGGVGMMLKVKNPFKAAIRYRLGMMVLESDNVYATSSCPVRGGILAMEMWPHPIFQLLVGDMKFIDKETDDFSCKK